MPDNTTSAQDRVCDNATRIAEENSENVIELIDAITELDGKLNDANDRIKELESDLMVAQQDVARLEREVSSLS